MKMPVKTSCAMATQQNTLLAQLLAQKQHFHMQLGHVQNEIRFFVNSNHASGANFVCLAQLQGWESYIQQNITTLESQIKAILNNRFIFMSYVILHHICSTFYLTYLICWLVVSAEMTSYKSREKGGSAGGDSIVWKYNLGGGRA